MLGSSTTSSDLKIINHAELLCSVPARFSMFLTTSYLRHLHFNHKEREIPGLLQQDALSNSSTYQRVLQGPVQVAGYCPDTCLKFFYSLAYTAVVPVDTILSNCEAI